MFAKYAQSAKRAADKLVLCPRNSLVLDDALLFHVAEADAALTLSGKLFGEPSQFSGENGTVPFEGELIKSGRGSLRLGPDAYASLLDEVSGGAGFASDVNVDLRDGRIVFDYADGASPASTVPAATVRSLLTASYATGFASGRIYSSTATVSTGLGWIDDPAARQVTVARALYGDANLDGTVDVEDFNRVLLNHDPSRAVWSWGDFNYDGQVNSVDLSMMLENYGQTLLPLGGGLLLSVDNIWVGESGESWGINENWSLERYPTVGENAVFPSNRGGMVSVNLEAYADTVVFEGDYTLYSSSSGTLTFDEMYVGTDKEVVISADLELIGEGKISNYGDLTLTGDNTYSGDTNVIEGELRVTGSIAYSAVTVENDATLSGTGITGDVTVLGTLSPGEYGIGILSTGNLAFGPGSGPHFRVNVTDDDSDQVDVTGTVALFGSAILDVVGNLQEVGDEVLVLIKNDEYDSIVGTFFELEEDAVVFVGDAPYMITYRYNAEGVRSGDGNDVALRPLKVKLHTIDYDATDPAKFHLIKKDSTGVAYGDIEWQDDDFDGEAEHEYPVSYTRSGAPNDVKMKAEVKIKVWDDLGDNLKVRATGTIAGQEIHLTEATPNAVLVNGYIEATVESQEAIPDEISDYLVALMWQVSVNGGGTWVDAGASINTAYLTWKDPVGSTPLFETSLDIGSQAADGMGSSSSDADVVTTIYTDGFADRSVYRVDGVQMRYWENDEATATDTAGLIKDANGQCGAWAELFMDVLAAQGISGTKKIEVKAASIDL